MKLLFVLLTVFATVPALAKGRFDGNGSITYHAEKLRNAIEGRNDLYYSDDYICTPGTDHYAPMCRTANEWYFTEEAEYAEVALDSGEKFILTKATCASPLNIPCKQEKWDRSIRTIRVPHFMEETDKTQDGLYSFLFLYWLRSYQGGNHPKDGETLPFRYQIKKLRSGESMISPELPVLRH